MSGDLAGWLLTQISEDERLINVWDVRAVLWPEEGHDPGECDECDHRRQHRAADDRLTDRLRAECAAKRAIIETLAPIAADDWFEPGAVFSPGDETEQAAFVLQMLAQPYSDRPGFRPEWQVTP